VTALLLFLLAQAQADTPREHVEAVAASSHTYRLTLGGVLDAANTRSPVGYGACSQAFEPMRSVTLENVGERDVVNPWILVNGKRRWRTAKEIALEALASYGDPAKMTEGEKARAIWEYQRHHRFHATTWDREVQDPVKLYNVYGYTLCGDEAIVLSDLWRLAGLKVRRGFPTGHVVSEVWYDGAWHLLDSDEHVICLLRDNRTIAGEEEIVRDHDLVKRTHTYGILAADSRKTDEFSASLYIHEGKRQGEHASRAGHTMDFTLRPGESLEWRWSHAGKQHTAGQALREGWGDAAWARLRNGRWTYRPDLRAPAARAGILSAENVRWSARAGEPALSPAEAGKPAVVVWKISSPYVLVGGSLRARGEGLAFRISFDGKEWSPVAPAASGPGFEAGLDRHFPALGPARYSVLVRLELAGGLDSIELAQDLQMAAFGLPSLELGENVIAYSDESKEPRAVRITHRWVERSGPPVPAPSAAPVAPADGGRVEGTRVVFEWKPVEGASDYHFQLADHAEFRWVLSPNFDKLLSRTADRGKARFALPYAGLLNPGQRVLGRGEAAVRAREGALVAPDRRGDRRAFRDAGGAGRGSGPDHGRDRRRGD
jgi:hypothetical protein